MSKVILLEGVDGCGKTTIAHSLINNHNYNYIHLSKLQPEQNIDEYYSTVIDIVRSYKKLNYNLVIDRGFITNLIYCHIFNDPKVISTEHSIELFNLIDLIIIGLPSYAEYTEDFKKLCETRYELYNDMSQVYRYYKDLWYGESTLDNIFADEVNAFGGLQNKAKFILYDRYSVSKDNVDNWINKVLEKLV